MKLSQLVCLFLAVPACGGTVGEHGENALDLGVEESELTTLQAPSGDSRRYVLGTVGTWSNAYQAHKETYGTILVPRSRHFTLRFSGWSGTTYNQVTSSYAEAESRMQAAAMYTYAHVSSNAYVLVRDAEVPIFNDYERVSTNGPISLRSFMRVDCTAGETLTDSLVGTYRRHAGGNDACVVNVDTYKMNLFCNGGATCFTRLMKHVAAYSLAYIGGLGRARYSTGLFATEMNVDTSVSKTSIPNAQACLARGWSDDNSPTQYVVSDGAHGVGLPSLY